MINIKDLRGFITKLQLRNTVSKVAGYKTNIHKSGAFLCTKDNKAKTEIRETMPFTTYKNKKQNPLTKTK